MNCYDLNINICNEKSPQYTYDFQFKSIDGEIIKLKSGKPKPNTNLRGYERIPLSESIDDYYETEVKPHVPESWMDRSKDKIGYELNFTKYFYKYEPLRPSSEILQDLIRLDKESEELINQVNND